MYYQANEEDEEDQENREDGEDEEDEENEKDEAIPEWVKMTKSRFDRIRSMIIRGVNNGLKTKIDNKTITLNNAKKMIEDIVSGKIDKNEAVSMYNNIIVIEFKTVMKSQSTKNTEDRKKW